jgi:hypothetical protein
MSEPLILDAFCDDLGTKRVVYQEANKVYIAWSWTYTCRFCKRPHDKTVVHALPVSITPGNQEQVSALLVFVESIDEIVPQMMMLGILGEGPDFMYPPEEIADIGTPDHDAPAHDPNLN